MTKTIVVTITGHAGTGKSLAMYVIVKALKKDGWLCSKSTYAPQLETITAEKEGECPQRKKKAKA
jgi:ABC-type glutathione transport system ATPase component